jgi:hypothetical protein
MDSGGGGDEINRPIMKIMDVSVKKIIVNKAITVFNAILTSKDISDIKVTSGTWEHHEHHNKYNLVFFSS